MTHKYPNTRSQCNNWLWKRRLFLKTVVAASVASSIPLWSSCAPEHQLYTFDSQQKNILSRVQNFLIPDDGDGPSATDLSALEYLQWVMLTEGVDKEDKEYILKGIIWVDETAKEEMNKPFLQLNWQQQNSILEWIAKEDWGESWLSMILNFVFEALFCDPIYGGNNNQKGWKWLEHNPGQPRPTEELKFGNFLNYVKASNNE